MRTRKKKPQKGKTKHSNASDWTMFLRTHWEYGCIVAASLFFSLLLSQAFPYGITTEETTGYFVVAQKFSWTAPNLLDWWRTPFLGFLYSAFLRWFANPTLAIFWLHAVLFACIAGLLLAVCRRIFEKRSSASLAAWTFLAVEIFSMRAFYFDTQISSDALYGRLAFLSVLLILYGWLSKRLTPIVIAYAAIGFLVVTRTAGLALLPLWLPFAFFACRSCLPKRAAWVCGGVLCMALALVPVLAWSARNEAVYGQFRPTGYASFQLLSRALPLLRDDDRIFPDAGVNARFLATERAFEQRVDIRSFDHMMPWGRIGRHNIYFPWITPMPPDGPFRFLRDAVAGAPPDNDVSPLNDPRQLFLIDAAALPVATAIIRQHPAEYAALVLSDYVQLFNPSQGILARKAEVFTEHVEDSYDQITTLQLYPPDGTVDLKKVNMGIRNAWWSATQNQLVLSLRAAWENSVAIAVHLSALIAAAVLLRARKNPTKTATTTARFALVVLLVFFTAAFHNFLLALTQPASYRFGIPGTSMNNTVYVLSIFAALAWIKNRLRNRTPRVTRLSQ